MDVSGTLVRDALLAFALIIVTAKIGGELLGRIAQPPVLGELLVGILLGNLGLFGITALDALRSNSLLDVVAQIGAVLLLFEVGLESELGAMLSVGGSALIASCLGVAAPLALGFYVAKIFLPGDDWIRHLFVGGTLTATSVGITARVLKDLGRTGCAEARIILGAAVVDDVIGLMVLAVITGLIAAAGGSGSAITLTQTAWVIAKALLFLVAAVIFGRLWSGRILRSAVRLRVPGVLIGLCIAFCFVLSGLAVMAGLAPILGAFAAGVVLEESHYRAFVERGERSLPELISPINTLLVPVFFVVMGMRMDLRSMGSTQVLGFAATITLAAILGKQVCGLGVLERGVDRLTIGIGMIPRGEVELIFAGMGMMLMLDGRPVLEDSTYSAVVLMVVLTTVLTPPLLKASFARTRRTKINEQPAKRIQSS